MKKLHLILILLAITVCCTGCTRPITGKIVDAETGQPIEGAILLVEWTRTHGFGNTYTTSEKVVELFSGKDGIVNIPGYDKPSNGPDVTIYKPGYVAWNNHWVFPDTSKRTDFEWKNGYVFRLEKFKDGYSYVDHESFISLCTHSTLPSDNKKLLEKIYLQSENSLIRKELDDRPKRR